MKFPWQNQNCTVPLLTSGFHFQMGKKEPSESLDRAIENMCRKTRDLRRQVIIISRFCSLGDVTQPSIGRLLENNAVWSIFVQLLHLLS